MCVVVGLFFPFSSSAIWNQKAKGGIKGDGICFDGDVLEKLPSLLD